MARTGIVPDTTNAEERSISLHQRALSPVKTEPVERSRFDDPGAIHETGGRFEARVERPDSVMKPPCTPGSIPVSLIKRSIPTIAQTVRPRAGSLELREVK